MIKADSWFLDFVSKFNYDPGGNSTKNGGFSSSGVALLWGYKCWGVEGSIEMHLIDGIVLHCRPPPTWNVCQCL